MKGIFADRFGRCRNVTWNQMLRLNRKEAHTSGIPCIILDCKGMTDEAISRIFSDADISQWRDFLLALEALEKANKCKSVILYPNDVQP